MHPARIAELLAPFLGTRPDNDQRPETKDALYHNISTYIDILLRWNARINLTAIRDPEEIVTRHFGESLFAARQLFADISGNSAAEFCPDPTAERRQNAAHRESRESAPSREQVLEERKPASLFTEGDQEFRPPLIFNGHERGEASDGKLSIADVGSGAGFPGIPFKLWNPRINLTLIESNHKKATFLREVARSLTLTNIDVFNGRAEDFNAGAHAHFDIVTLRAVERFKDALQISASLLGSGGRLSLLIGNSQQEAAARILPSFSWSPAIPIPLSQLRILLVGVSPES